MAPKSTQPVHPHDSRLATPLGHIPSHGSPSTDVTPHAPSIANHKTAPFMATLQQTAGGPLPELMTLAELCAFLKVKPSYLYSLTSTDRIPYRKFAGTLRFVKAEILQWLDRARRGPRMAGPARSDG